MEIDTVSMDGEIYRLLTGIPSLVFRHINLSRRSNDFLSQWVLLYIILVEKSVSWMGFNLIIHSTYDTGLTNIGLIYDTGLTVRNNRLVLGDE